MKKLIGAMTLLLTFAAISSITQSAGQSQASLSVKQVMNAMLTPMTNIIWGAQELNTPAQRQDVTNAALTIIGAANLLAQGGSGDQDNTWAAESDWQSFNQEMVAAAEAVIAAVEAQDMDALFNAGNDQLYPPCENCHQKYQVR